MWVPSLLAASSSSSAPLPTGLIFSSFMLSMTLGGMLFALLLPRFPGGAEALCCFVYLMAAGSMAAPLIFNDFFSVLISFLVLEAMVGMFGSCGATLRSRYYPEQHQSALMSVFRLPLNALVVVGTKLTDSVSDKGQMRVVFAVLVAMHLVAAVLQILLQLSAVPSDKVNVVVDKKKKKL
jgi:MFS family permease